MEHHGIKGEARHTLSVAVREAVYHKSVLQNHHTQHAMFKSNRNRLYCAPYLWCCLSFDSFLFLLLFCLIYGYLGSPIKVAYSVARSVCSFMHSMSGDQDCITISSDLLLARTKTCCQSRSNGSELWRLLPYISFDSFLFLLLFCLIYGYLGSPIKVAYSVARSVCSFIYSMSGDQDCIIISSDLLLARMKTCCQSRSNGSELWRLLLYILIRVSWSGLGVIV